MTGAFSPASDDRAGRRLEPIDVALSRLRLIIAGGVVVPLLSRPDAGRTTLPPLLVASVIGAVLLLVNVVSRFAARTRSDRVAWILSVVTLIVDSAGTVLIVSRLDLLDERVVWALLVIPVLEGALLFRMRGALITWIGVSAAYVALELSIPASFASPETQAAFLEQMQTLLYRSGIVLLVAVPGGYLSEQLLRAIAAQRAGQRAAAHRSALLVEVVNAGRSLSDLGADFRSTVVDAAVRVGFDIADCHDIATSDRHRRARSSTFAGSETALDNIDVVATTARAVADQHVVLIIGGAGEQPENVAELAEHGLGTVVICPIRGADGTTGVLRAATRLGREPSRHEIECLELLAGQASVAVDNDALVGRLHDVQGHLEHQANHDVLTHLPNRLYFQRRLEEALSELAGRDDGAGHLCLLFLDLDGFKAVNDSLGHETGDDLLIAVAGRLQNVCRRSDTVARLGGDEFIMLLPDTTEEGGEQAARHICERLTAPFQLGDETVAISASVGLVATSVALEPDELMRQVDVAMYQAKARGRARWQVHTPDMDAEEQERIALQKDLRQVLEDGQLDAAYQPITNLRTNAVDAVEILARWNHPERGPIAANRFIEVAEYSTLILELGTQMLHKACAALHELHSLGDMSELSMSVNVSPHQARRHGFMTTVMDTLTATRVDTRHLILELTEGVLVSEDVLGVLVDLRSAGIRIAIDDFGQGHTSIAALGRIPADMLKIDRHFVHEAACDPSRTAILRSMIRFGHDLGLSVIAEGVETADDLEHVLMLGCDAAQGYYLGRPVPLETLALSRMTSVSDHARSTSGGVL